MRYERFKELVVERLKEYLPEGGENMEVIPTYYTKSNGAVCDGIRIREQGNCMSVNFDLRNFYRMYESGESFFRILRTIADSYIQGMQNAPETDILMKPYEQLKDKLFVAVENMERNNKLPEGIVHEQKENLILLYRLKMESLNEVYSCSVNDVLLKRWGVSQEQFIQDAWESMRKNMPPVFFDSDMALHALWTDNDYGSITCEALSPGKMMYQLSNSEGCFGAVYMFDDLLMSQVAQKLGSNFYVLPSSKHDVMIVPDYQDKDVDKLRETVLEVNQNVLKDDEWLSDEVYYFDKEIGSVKMIPEMEQEHSMGMEM